MNPLQIAQRLLEIHAALSDPEVTASQRVRQVSVELLTLVTQINTAAVAAAAKGA